MKTGHLCCAMLLALALSCCHTGNAPGTVGPAPATPTPAALVLGGRVRLQGRVNHAGVRVTVAVLGATETKSDGTYSLPGLTQPGVYAITADMPGFLPAEGTLEVPQEAQAFVVPEITLLAGELTRDRAIDLYDLVTLGTLVGKETEAAAYGDLNADGSLSKEDLVLLANNLGTVGPIPVQ